MVERQETGFRFGKYKLTVLESMGEVKHNGRTYRLVLVRTEGGEHYLALRLYNRRGRFIKQFLMEPEVCGKLAILLNYAYSKMVMSRGVNPVGAAMDG